MRRLCTKHRRETNLTGFQTHINLLRGGWCVTIRVTCALVHERRQISRIAYCSICKQWSPALRNVTFFSSVNGSYQLCGRGIMNAFCGHHFPSLDSVPNYLSTIDGTYTTQWCVSGNVLGCRKGGGTNEQLLPFNQTPVMCAATVC